MVILSDYTTKVSYLHELMSNRKARACKILRGRGGCGSKNKQQFEPDIAYG